MCAQIKCGMKTKTHVFSVLPYECTTQSTMGAKDFCPNYEPFVAFIGQNMKPLCLFLYQKIAQ